MLYIVATPIGNLGDITYRAVETLRNCEYILCEDTRTSMTLLKAYDINKKMVSYHKFNEASKCEAIAKDLEKGVDIALISDAGMPGISDPGAVLVKYLKERGLCYTVISGASALINAFVLSGYDAPFIFVGFLPDKTKAKKDLLNSLSKSEFCSIYYVSPHSINNFFEDMLSSFGDREVCVVRELTKKFEEVNFTTLKEGYKGVVKGEFVCIVKGADAKTKEVSDEEIISELNSLISLGKTSKEAIALVSDKYNIKKNYVYDMYLKNK